MNYYYDPAVAAKLAAWVNYICPVEGAQEEMEKLDPSAGRQPADLPDRRDFAQDTFAFMPLTETQSKQYERDFTDAPEADAMTATELAPDRTRPRSPVGPTGAAPRARHQAVRRPSPPSTTCPSTVPQGSFFALLGPSGCGKTTTLRMVAGLEQPTSGHGSSSATTTSRTLKPYKRPVNTVFQNYALFPHLTISENVAFGLRRRGIKDTKARSRTMLELVELEGAGSTRSRPSCPVASSSAWRSAAP